MSAVISITVNGKPEAVNSGSSITTLLAAKNCNPACVVVELNKGIIQKEKFSSVVLKVNDSVEVLHFVGGG
jgi:sulfur carrier protein